MPALEETATPRGTTSSSLWPLWHCGFLSPVLLAPFPCALPGSIFIISCSLPPIFKYEIFENRGKKELPYTHHSDSTVTMIFAMFNSFILLYFFPLLLKYKSKFQLSCQFISIYLVYISGEKNLYLHLISASLCRPRPASYTQFPPYELPPRVWYLGKIKENLKRKTAS